VLLAALLGVRALALSSRLRAETPGMLEVTPLADSLFAISGAGANVVVLAGPDGLLLVDGGLAQHSGALLALLAERWPGKPVRTLFNTNWWWEHTGSNEALRRAGAEVIAHENTKLWLGNDFTIDWLDDRAHPPCPPAALPTRTFYTAGELDFGGEPVRYANLAQAHTDGDLYVHFPRSNVLVVSDLLAVGRYPVVDYVTGGWIGGMANAAKALLAIADDTTRIVPALGPVQTRTQLERYHALCQTLKDRVAGLLKSGLSLEEVIEAKPTADYDAAWGDPELFLTLAYKGLWGHVRELGGVL
jgi:glyoxylase-like metal-dependent hydrolase (beta-lactamase superfamily II)